MSSNMVSELVAGDTLDFLDVVPAYPATDGWTLKYRLAPRNAGGQVIAINALVEGADYRVQAAPSATANWAAGEYTWARWVEKTGARQSLGSGQLVIRPDPATLPAGYDGRSQARKALDDCKAAYAAFVGSNGTRRRYKIGEREMEFASSADIVKQINYWQIQVNREVRQEAINAGLPDPRKAYVRLNRD